MKIRNTLSESILHAHYTDHGKILDYITSDSKWAGVCVLAIILQEIL